LPKAVKVNGKAQKSLGRLAPLCAHGRGTASDCCPALRCPRREERRSFGSLSLIMGMIPLVLDAFYVSMAVTIMFGLAFAAVLTLIFVPVLYAVFFWIPCAKAR